eukprot:COSAG01_NODE_855_length_13088_cov_13.421511_4_plen_87_part_00
MAARHQLLWHRLLWHGLWTGPGAVHCIMRGAPAGAAVAAHDSAGEGAGRRRSGASATAAAGRCSQMWPNKKSGYAGNSYSCTDRRR